MVLRGEKGQLNERVRSGNCFVCKKCSSETVKERRDRQQ